jgi:hypothetical protein
VSETNTVWVKVKSYKTHDHWDGEPYGDWSTTHEYGGAEVKLTGMGEFGYSSNSVEVGFEPKADQVVWAVIVEYSSGDTFGHSSGNTTVVGVYDDGVVASIVKGMIEDDYKNNYDSYQELKVEGHPDIYTYTWKGYFESLENIHVERVHINP